MRRRLREVAAWLPLAAVWGFLAWLVAEDYRYRGLVADAWRSGQRWIAVDTLAPEPHERTRVQLGTRVRIALPGEPDAMHTGAAGDFPCGGRVMDHLRDFDGRTGTVTECRGGFPCQYGMQVGGHGFVVAYDRPLEYFGFRLIAGHYALSELRELVCVKCGGSWPCAAADYAAKHPEVRSDHRPRAGDTEASRPNVSYPQTEA